jgi:hypothetical protein
MHRSSESVDRPSLVRATVRPVAADVWLRATALKTLSTPLERGPVAEVHLDPVAPRGGVIEEQRLAFLAG